MKRKNTCIGHYIRNLAFDGAILFLISLIFGAAAIAMYTAKQTFKWYWLAFLVFVGLALPFVIYNLCQLIYYLNIRFEKIKNGRVIDCETEQTSRLGVFISFRVVIKENDEEVTINTRPVYGKPDGYFNRMIEVGYDPKRREWIELQ